jgi:hypothetical protein
MMNKNESSETKPDKSETPLPQRPSDRSPKHRKPLPDGEAIAEVGDALGGPA